MIVVGEIVDRSRTDLLRIAQSHQRKPIRTYPSMSFFCEIRSSDNVVLKCDGGFPTQDAAKIAGREDAKKMRNMRQPDRPEVGRILVGQNAEKAAQY